MQTNPTPDALVERLRRLLPLLSQITVRQAINAGDQVIDACGLNPWCMNEGLATGGEPALSSWQIESIEADLSTLAAMQERIERLEEGLNAIIDRGPERDIKWAGMTARDIARTARGE